MSRRINFTGRRRITRDRVSLRLARGDSGVLTATMETLNLSGLDLPSDARIVVEIYHQTYFHRFECGSVGDPVLPRESEISEFDAPNILKCRVKVLGESPSDAGKILAQADRMSVHAEPDAVAVQGILRIGPGDLGSVLWALDFEDGPQLLINSDADDWREVAHNPWFRALVFPEVVRRVALWVLDSLVRGDEPGEDEDLNAWCLYFRDALGVDAEKAVEEGDVDLQEWSDAARSAFAETFNLERLWMPLISPEVDVP